MTTTSCESCGMPIETGRYCAHCTAQDGGLQPFEERFEKMVAFQARREPEASREARGGSARTWPRCPRGATIRRCARRAENPTCVAWTRPYPQACLRPRSPPRPSSTLPCSTQFEAFIDEHRTDLAACLDGLSEEQARRSLVPSRTTLLGLVKHGTFVERVWFGEGVERLTRAEMGIPATPDESFVLDDGGHDRVREGRVCPGMYGVAPGGGRDDAGRPRARQPPRTAAAALGLPPRAA